jgi:hypothetical protein
MQDTGPGIQTAQAQVPGVTLLELVTRLNETTGSEAETVETALELLEAGRVRLIGNFRGCRLESA